MLSALLGMFLAAAPRPAVAGVCDNEGLTAHPALLVIVPHPDDEVLGFGGLLLAYAQQQKAVRVVVVTDGDAACGACAFWNSAGTSAEPCRADALAAFGSARRQETAASTQLLGHPGLVFLGYPDGSLALGKDSPDQPLSRALCAEGTARVHTQLTGATLARDLEQLLAELPDDGLVATTESDADHPDHAALGALVETLNLTLAHPHRLVRGRIHPPAGLVGAECAYPGPAAVDCGCFERGAAHYDSNPRLLESLRQARLLPDEPAQPPPERQAALRFCLSPAAETLKAEAISRLATQIGDRGRDGREVPLPRRGFLDCTGFLNGFVRTTELYQIAPPAMDGHPDAATPR